MRRTRRPPDDWPALAITTSSLAVLIGFWHAIGFSTFVSDPLNYWADSLYWQHPYNSFHVPGFPLLIALIRGITFDVMSPTTLMTLITAVALLAGVHGTYRLASAIGLSSRSSIAAATAFGIWPFVGTVYSAFPVADPLVLALIVWAAFHAVRRRAVPTGLLLGLAAVTHKSLWPAIALVAVGSLVWSPRTRRFGTTVAALTAAPLVALWIAGMADGHSVTWITSASASDGLQPLARNSLPIFDGLLGNLIYGDWVARARVVVLVPIVALALVIFVSSYRRWREPLAFISTAFALQILGLALVMNQHLVWSSVRFSGLLAVPAASLAAARIDAMPRARWHAVASTTVVALVGTQLLTAWEGSGRGWLGVL